MSLNTVIENCSTWNSFASNTGLAGYATNDNYGGTAATGYVYTDNYFGSHWCYPHYTWITSPCLDKTSQAYKIVRALMKKKVLKIDDLTDFFEAMDAVIETL